MEFGGRGAVTGGGPSSAAATVAVLSQESLQQMELRGGESMEGSSYPERPGEPDCGYYMRTGLCRFGTTCKFNHPPNRNLVVAAARNRGYPERVGQPECQYYLKTGTCKYGDTCKFHHPRDKAGITGRVQLNILGYPLRPNEKECAYYLRTGQCKFGSICKFHHPQPSNAMVSVRGSPVYTSVQSLPNPSQQTYTGGLANWTTPRASFIPSPRWEGQSSYTQLILPQGLVQLPSWARHSGQLGSSSSESQQTHGITRRDSIFPERPGEPECQFYMKTGDCKFGAVCKFHHPRERLIPAPDCALSPLGLPLRPGGTVCGFYSRYGICKFGPNCKFDHPMGTFTYGLQPSSTADVPAVRHPQRSSSGPHTSTLLLEGPVNASSGMSRRVPMSDSLQIASANEDVEEKAE